ncbi:putative essential protein Yae1, N terminal [Lyophyllum shimeji]|uniref:Protein YAE1 n=1 Tax=Lyophyllum shimeji TaxID=47721 RepID=A0A9P3PY58_LYOSH|nr:putative essential protein Yae1, N terminal [Lyophyllum shimeji]
MDTPWDDTRDTETAWKTVREAEWSKMTSEFYNVGYREGITAGKEASVQEGFDAGFADVGVPLGRDLGLVRGHSSALLSFLISAPSAATLGLSDDEKEALMQEAREIVTLLGNIRYSDIEPRDLEAERHAREHLEAEGEEMEVSEEIEKRKQMEGVEDMLASLSTGEHAHGSSLFEENKGLDR